MIPFFTVFTVYTVIILFLFTKIKSSLLKMPVCVNSPFILYNTR